MKNKLIIFLTLITLVLSSCYEDQSNDSWQMVNPIQFDYNGNTGKGQVGVGGFFQEELVLDPVVFKEGTSDANLSFKWTIEGQGIKTEVLGTQQTLRILLDIPPQLYPYNLIYNIRDNNTGIERNVHFVLTVTSPFASGLIVADTRDERTSDLNLIISRPFNSQVKYGEDRFYKTIYSQVNGQPIEGLVKDVQTKTFPENRSLTIMTEEGSIIRADHYDYIRLDYECNKNIFVIQPETMKPEKFFLEADTGNEYMICGGKLYHRSCFDKNRKYGYYMFLPNRLECNITYGFATTNKNGKEYYGNWMWDSKASGIIYVEMGRMYQPADQTSALFDINSMKGLTPVYFGHARALNEIHMIMQETSSGKLKDYVAYSDKGRASTDVTKEIIDISNDEGIDRAIAFATNIQESRIYFTDGQKIYSRSLINGIVSSQYTLPPEHGKITNIEVCNYAGGQIRYKDLSPTSINGYKEIAAKNRVMIVTVYNEVTKEGKVILIPIPNINDDLEQDSNFHIVYGGYGRILKVAKQDR